MYQDGQLFEGDIRDPSMIGAGGTKANFVTFETKAVEIPSRRANGVPYFEDSDFMNIHLPGGLDVVTHEITADFFEVHADKAEYEPRYRKWKQKKGDGVQGFPVAEWHPLTKSQVAMLHAINIFTVEQLAVASDATVQRIGMGGMALKSQAASWLEQAAGGTAIERLTRENLKKDELIEDLSEKVEALVGRIKQLEAGSGKKKKGKKAPVAEPDDELDEDPDEEEEDV